MDSGNSASMQSSSGGDDDYDSRAADSIMAAFLTSTPPTHAGSFAGNFHPPTPPPPPQSSSASHVFNHFSTLFDPTNSLPNQNPLLNFDIPWTRTHRSDQIPPEDLPGPPSNSTTAAAAADHNNLSSISNFPGGVHNFSHPPDATTNSFRRIKNHTELQNDIPNNCGGGGGGGGLHPKKRARASRRAPTTVMTTNTTNFRAMVQEFTGIPAPPFTASSSSPFTRNASTFGGGAAAAHLDTLPHALFRPFPQKPTFNAAGGNSQNQILEINNNMFQWNTKINIPSSNVVLNDENVKMSIFEEFCLSSTNSHGLPPPAAQSTTNNNPPPPPPARWMELNQQAGGHGGVNYLRSGHGNYYYMNGKFIRYATGNANSSVAPREGMVEPWICSSD